MKNIFFVVVGLLIFSSVRSQFIGEASTYPVAFERSNNSGFFYQAPYSKTKLYQRNYGAIIGIQRGANTSFELGAEAHWRKFSLRDPRITGANASMEYNFRDNVIGYKAGLWKKHGRVNLTYGGHLAYFTDFKGNHRYGLGPSVGFRLLGFHLINGYNFLGGDRELDQVNKLYISLRYYFPVQNKFVWDRSDKNKKIKERERKKKAREKEKRKQSRKKGKEKEEEPKGIKKILDVFKKEKE